MGQRPRPMEPSSRHPLSLRVVAGLGLLVVVGVIQIGILLLVSHEYIVVAEQGRTTRMAYLLTAGIPMGLVGLAVLLLWRVYRRRTPVVGAMSGALGFLILAGGNWTIDANCGIIEPPPNSNSAVRLHTVPELHWGIGARWLFGKRVFLPYVGVSTVEDGLSCYVTIGGIPVGLAVLLLAGWIWRAKLPEKVITWMAMRKK